VDIEAQMNGAGNLVDVLAACALGADGGQFYFVEGYDWRANDLVSKRNILSVPAASQKRELAYPTNADE
jgi:hypothetical protein